MDNIEFVSKVKEISGKRGVVWVTAGFVYGMDSLDTINSLFSALVECKQCGKCCTGFWFKTIPLLIGDYEQMKEGTGMTDEELRKTMELMDFGGKSVVCLSEPCYFFKDGGCSIYDYRPKVCRYFPTIVEDKIKINVSCPAGLECYMKITNKGNNKLDTVGLE